MPLTFGSLFSGIGGIDLGFEWAGMECLWQIENDSYCNKILARHWPTIPRYGDIEGVKGADLPTPDVICGGFPCQPVSYAGRRKGRGDPRWLWPQMARLVDEVRPAYVVVENVPGLLSQGGSEVLADLATMGFDAEWGIVSARDADAPHVRERVWIVAYPKGAGAGMESRLTSDQGRETADRGGTRLQRGSVNTPDVGAGAGGGGQDDVADPNPLRRVGVAEENGKNGILDLQPGDDAPGRGIGSGGDRVADTDKARWGDDRQGAERRRVDGGGAGTDPSAGGRYRKKLSRRGGGFQDWWAVEPSVGRVANGVPDRVDRIRALGNAVVPQVATIIARRVVEIHAHITD